MPRHTTPSVLIAIAACVVGAAGLGVLPASAATPAGPPPSSAPRPVTLVTGDVVSVSTQAGGRQAASVLRANPDGPGGRFQTFNLGADLYVVPQSAVPYLGSTMDLALFDVTNPPSSVHVTYRPGPSTSAVPTGRAFGAALADQALRDHASPTHTTGLFANVARISASASAVVAPNFVMHTLTVNGVDQTGAADTGDDVVIYNVDDLRKYGGQAIWRQGLAKVSVPAGHYAAISFFYDYQADVARMVTLPQFSVTADSAITVDARAATAPVSVTTPQPATPAVNEVSFGRTDKLGETGSYTFLGGGTTSFVVQPTTKRITVGQLHYYVYTPFVRTLVQL
ncbi:MAG TPA: hypothetical protein VGL39_17155 [Jatrophihabitantaceae bacterium]